MLKTSNPFDSFFDAAYGETAAVADLLTSPTVKASTEGTGTAASVMTEGADFLWCTEIAHGDKHAADDHQDVDVFGFSALNSSSGAMADTARTGTSGAGTSGTAATIAGVLGGSPQRDGMQNAHNMQSADQRLQQ